jgi:hypothetical protein
VADDEADTPLEFAVVVENEPELVMLAALKLPVASRFTIALAVWLLVGDTIQARLSVPVPVTGEPLTV